MIALTKEKRKFLVAHLGEAKVRQLEEDGAGDKDLDRLHERLKGARGRMEGLLTAYKEGPQSFDEFDALAQARTLGDVFLGIITNILTNPDLSPEEKADKVEAASRELAERLQEPPRREVGRPSEKQRADESNPFTRCYVDGLLRGRKAKEPSAEVKSLRESGDPADALVAALLEGQIEQESGSIRGGSS